MICCTYKKYHLILKRCRQLLIIWRNEETCRNGGRKNVSTRFIGTIHNDYRCSFSTRLIAFAIIEGVDPIQGKDDISLKNYSNLTTSSLIDPTCFQVAVNVGWTGRAKVRTRDHRPKGKKVLITKQYGRRAVIEGRSASTHRVHIATLWICNWRHIHPHIHAIIPEKNLLWFITNCLEGALIWIGSRQWHRYSIEIGRGYSSLWIRLPSIAFQQATFAISRQGCMTINRSNYTIKW